MQVWEWMLQIFGAQYDHMYIPELGHNVSVTDYAHTLYIRASWTEFNPQEDVYGWKIDSNLRAYIEGALSAEYAFGISCCS